MNLKHDKTYVLHSILDGHPAIFGVHNKLFECDKTEVKNVDCIPLCRNVPKSAPPAAQRRARM
eukprot:1179333-Prorocentrum_minimum.AAC.1